MQRCFTRLRSLGLQSNHFLTASASTPHRLLHAPSPPIHQSLTSAPSRSVMTSLGSFSSSLAASSLYPYPPVASLNFPSAAASLLQVRHVSSRDRRSKRKPTTPLVSKLKKTKMKFYSYVFDLFEIYRNHFW